MTQLVLSLFPGIGLLDMAFEEEGFCVVRGPDVIWGGDVRQFHPPAGRFNGVIGGPPCQSFSSMVHLIRHNGNEPSFGNLIPEFERCVAEADPSWFVMENVPFAPLPEVPGYEVWSVLLSDFQVGGTQPRQRRISLGMKEGEWSPLWSPLANIEYQDTVRPDGRSVVGGARVQPQEKRRKDRGGGELPHIGAMMSVEDMLEAQGLPRGHLDMSPLTAVGKRKVVGNGVPLPMGRAIARAVYRARGEE